MTNKLLHLLGNDRIAGRGFRHDPDDGILIMDKDPDDHIVVSIEIGKLLTELDEISSLDLSAENVAVESHSNSATRIDVRLGEGPHTTKPGLLRLRIATIGGERFDQSLRLLAQNR